MTVLALLLAPGAVEIALAYVHDDTMYQPLSVSSYALGGYTLVFWSLFAGTAYIVLLSCRLFVYVAPAILIKLAVWTTGSVPRRFDLVLGYVADLHRYISTCIFLVLLTAVFQEVFRPDVNRLGTNVGE